MSDTRTTNVLNRVLLLQTGEHRLRAAGAVAEIRLEVELGHDHGPLVVAYVWVPYKFHRVSHRIGGDYLVASAPAQWCIIGIAAELNDRQEDRVR